MSGEEHWAATGGKVKTKMVGCLPGIGGGLILTRTTTKTPTVMTARKTTNSFFDTTTNLWSDAFLAGRGADLDNDDNGNNNGRGEGLILMKTTMKTPTVMTPWSVTTSVFDITTNLWSDAFLAGRGG